jgi:hypothetical protein
MNSNNYKIKEHWSKDGTRHSIPATNEDISSFSMKNNLLLPQDLVEYFTTLNGSSDGYDGELFKFYSLSQFITVEDELGEWGGIPDYRNIVTLLSDHADCFVFADYSFHLLSYAIRLYPHPSDVNEVYVICGEKFKIIANSFTEFMDLYLLNSAEIYF